MDTRPIGCFDSGLGGVSVLRSFIQTLPNESYIYYGDNKNAPYGDKPVDDIIRLSMDCCDFLLDKGVKVIAVACNTATSAALTTLRAQYSLPIVAMEPAIRPAAQMLGEGKMLVMATYNTLSLDHYQNRVHEIGMDEKAINLPCGEIVEMVERGVTNSPEMHGLIRRLFAPVEGENVEVVVLGCTHFVFVRPTVEEIAGRIWPGVKVIDGNEGTARQLKRVLMENGLDCPEGSKGSVSFYTSGDAEFYRPLFQNLLE